MTLGEKAPNISKSESFKFVLPYLRVSIRINACRPNHEIVSVLEETYFMTIYYFPSDNQIKKALTAYTWNNIYNDLCIK